MVAMRLTRLGVLGVLACARVADADPEAKTSLAIESDEAGWQRTGFRLGLGLADGDLAGLHGAPSGRLLGPFVHMGLRLDRDWSLYTTFQYESASRAGGLSGLRFSGTLDPTWHVTSSLAVGVGLGFGGIVEGRSGRADVDPLGSTLDTSYTFPDSTHPLPSCNGVGMTGLLRGTYAYVLGPRSAAVVELEVMGQDTACVEATGKVEPDTAQPIVRRQYWSHAGGQLMVGVMWR